MMLEIGKVYSFNTVAPAILTARRDRVRLVSMLDYDEATRYDNIYLKHRQIYPLLPIGTPDDPRLFLYYRFKTENNEMFIMAEPWIVESSIELVSAVNIFIRVNNATLSDVNSIRDALVVAGYTDFQLNTTGA